MAANKFGPRIKNPVTYEALLKKYPPKKAAMISNGVLKKGHKKGKHRRPASKKKGR